MQLLPGNRTIQTEYVQRHINTWGDRIQVAANPMSGLLSEGEVVIMDGKLVRPMVYIIHGQHRKLVLENRIRNLLCQEARDSNVHTSQYIFPSITSFTSEEVNKHPDAYWVMDLYKPGKLHSMTQAMSC